MKHKIGERIRKARMLSGLSQQNIADELGLTIASYSNIERGVTDLTITRLYEIATILNEKIENLLELNIHNSGVNDTGTPYEIKNEKSLTELFQMIEKLQLDMKKIQETKDENH